MMYFFDNVGKQRALTAQRGFTLLIAVIFSTVVLSVGLALLDISLKQITLAAAARQSEYAFYNADSALECALYWDSVDKFDYTSEPMSGSLTCEGQTLNSTTTPASGGSRTTTWTMSCAGDNTPGDGSGDVTVVKESTGNTFFYADGYNTCVASSPQRVERGEEAKY